MDATQAHKYLRELLIIRTPEPLAQDFARNSLYLGCHCMPAWLVYRYHTSLCPVIPWSPQRMVFHCIGPRALTSYVTRADLSAFGGLRINCLFWAFHQKYQRQELTEGMTTGW